ncbi:MAG: diguanylate cyclase domain-containing protein, partial [Marinobacter sp.]
GLSGVSGLLVKRALKPLVHTLSNQAEEIARSSEELRLAYQVFEHTHEMVVISDLSLNIIRANPAFIDVTGLPGRKVVHKKVTDFLVSEMAEQEIVYWLQTQLATEKMWQGEVWLQTAKGRATPFLVTVSAVTDSQGTAQQYVLTFTDITERVKSETRIRQLAHHDELTGLPNRAALEQHLRQTIDQCHTTGTRFAVLCLDLDKFKPVNDIYGHQAGDEILVNVAKRLTNCLREGDFVGRRGGDEFQIITGPLRRPEDARPVAEKVVAVLNETFEIKGHIVDIGASVGVALYPDDGVTAMDLVNSADAAMYQVKASGRNAVGFA